MIRKVIKLSAAAAAFAAAAGVIVVAVAYALFALLRDTLQFTPAAASAITAAAFAVLLAIVGLILAGRRPHRHAPEPEASPVERLVDMARQRPVLAAAALVAGSFIVIRNPGMVASLVMGLMAPKPDPHTRRR